MTFLNSFDGWKEYVTPDDVLKAVSEMNVIFVSPINSDFSRWEVAYYEGNPSQASKYYAEYRCMIEVFPQTPVMAI